MPTKKERFEELKERPPGVWMGSGFARFPTIEGTQYEEKWTFKTVPDKETIQYEQHTWYRNETVTNGKTVFWDTGFILLKDSEILLVSAQSGGRVETYQLSEDESVRLLFNSVAIGNDPKTIRSQRVLHLSGNELKYELNMSTHQASEFQNHLAASLTRVKD